MTRVTAKRWIIFRKFGNVVCNVFVGCALVFCDSIHNLSRYYFKARIFAVECLSWATKQTFSCVFIVVNFLLSHEDRLLLVSQKLLLVKLGANLLLAWGLVNVVSFFRSKVSLDWFRSVYILNLFFFLLINGTSSLQPCWRQLQLSVHLR